MDGIQISFRNDINELTEAMLIILEAGGFKGGGINFDAKDQKKFYRPPKTCSMHILVGIDVFARALITADNILQKSDYKKARKDRYASYDSGKGKEFENGQAVARRPQGPMPIENGEPCQ